MQDVPCDARERLLFLTKLAEQAERYDEMLEYAMDMCRLPGELSVEERNLLSVAFKNAVGARRAAHRIVSSIEERERMNENDLNWSLASAFRRKTGDEIRRLCCAVRELLDERPPTSGDARLFFAKMRLDSSRFSAEVLEGAAKTAALKEADADAAKVQQSVNSLAATDPIRLGLSLSWAVWTCEVQNDRREAIRLAQTAFDEALADLDQLREDNYKDATLIMKLLQENLQKWTSDESAQ